MIFRATLLFFLSSFFGSASAQDVACEPINIFAAASTTNVIEEIAAAYERESACSVTTVFAASGTLARQIASGAPADIFLSADIQWTDWLEQSGKIRPSNRVNLLGNDLVLVVPKTANISETDFSDPRSLIEFIGNERLAVGDPTSVPAGRYALSMLRQLGVSDQLKDKIVTAGSVRAALVWVARGEAGAGIVYRTDAAIEEDIKIAYAFPTPAETPIIYPMALIGRTPNQAAQGFYQHLQSYIAATTFADFGFRRVSEQ
jgi:molybdate transport system substrate-binding protein